MHAPDDAAAGPLRDPVSRSEAATRLSPAPGPVLGPPGYLAPGARVRAAWPWWQRVLFRYALLHAVLYMAPMPLSAFVQMLIGLATRVDGWLAPDAAATAAAAEPSWLASTAVWLREHPASWFAEVEQWWQGATTWVAAQSWQQDVLGFEVLHQPTGSGDTGHHFVRLLLIVAASLLLTGVWSVLDRRRIGYRRLGRWLHLGARFYLGYWMLVYGGIKFYAGQFPEPGIARLTNEIGDTSPMGMVWTFLGASKPYEVFGGVCEALGGILLFHRRTALLGCFVTIATMTNVCALNWMYDVPVKLFSTHLWLFAVALLAPWAKRLWALFVSNRPSEPVDLRVVHSAWLGWPLAVLGWFWVGGTLVTMHFGNVEAMERRADNAAKPALYGRWDVERMLLDGEEVAAADASRWRFLAIDRGGRAFYRTAAGAQRSFSYAEDLAKGEITLTTASDAEPDARTLRVEQGTKTLAAPHPAPRTRQDFGERVDAERRTLSLKGEWQGQLLELELVEHVFLLHRGFHWVQEMPFNR